MSRIGRQPIDLPSGVSVSISPGRVMVNGPLGELSQEVPSRMKRRASFACMNASRMISSEMPLILMSIWSAVTPFAEPVILKSMSP